MSVNNSFRALKDRKVTKKIIPNILDFLLGYKTENGIKMLER